MRRLFLAWILMLLVSDTVSAQETNIRDVFKQMPDSIMPYLSANNRLDFLDFMDSNMKAEVKNRLEGTSEMTALSDDSLSIRMSEALRVDMFMMKLDVPMDSIQQVVVFVETFLTDSVYGESTIRFYTPEWQIITKTIPWNEIQQRYIEKHNLQNIPKWRTDLFKKD